jgi:hypothetical protein
MKRMYLLAACAIGFLFVAAPIYMKYETRALTLNGARSQFNAQLVNNTWAIPLEDFAKAFGGGITLEPNFQLQGNKLISISSGGDKTAKKVAPAPSSTPNTIGGSAATIKLTNPGALHVRKAGVVSNNVFTANGQKWVPLADVARALGGTFTAPVGTLQPGQTLTLNFAVNGDGIIGPE